MFLTQLNVFLTQLNVFLMSKFPCFYSLGSHAYQIARSHTHLPYFAHILELMLHEILEEEAPGSIPIPGQYGLQDIVLVVLKQNVITSDIVDRIS